MQERAFWGGLSFVLEMQFNYTPCIFTTKVLKRTLGSIKFRGFVAFPPATGVSFVRKLQVQTHPLYFAL